MEMRKQIYGSLLVGLLISTGAASAAECPPAYTFTGEADEDHLGFSVSGAGDVNNDGFDDLIVGASGNDAGGVDAGQAYVYSGQSGVLLYTFTGEAAGDYFGSVSGAGDVNNDGFDDLIVGARGNDAGGDHGGRAYVYSGQSGVLLYTFTAEAAWDFFGSSVSGAGDVNNDGFDDLIIGAYSNDTGGYNAGRAYVYSGQSGTLLYTFTGWEEDNLGYSVSGAGDVNNDGFDDFIVGARWSFYHTGKAHVYSGQSGTQLYTFTGEAEGDAFGTSVSGAGDVNNDGFDDLIVGASWYGGTWLWGRAYVYSGQSGTLLYTFTGEGAENFFGGSVSGAGDVNNDGFDDLIIGANSNNAGGTNAGRAYVYSGQSGTLLYTFTGEAGYDFLGGSVSGAGDVNNDGFDDLIIGAYGNDAGGSNVGAAYVFTLAVWYEDFDGDGYGNPDSSMLQCEQPTGYVLDSADCNDTDSLINPETVWYKDFDGDGYGNPDSSMLQCEQPTGYVLDSADCNDTDSLINLATVWYEDSDGDSLGDASSTTVSCVQPAGYVSDSTDNCPGVYNPNQADTDGDGIGDACCCVISGDLDQTGSVDVADLTFLVDYLFRGGPGSGCPSHGDVNGSGGTDVADLTYLVDYLFGGGPAPVVCP